MSNNSFHPSTEPRFYIDKMGTMWANVGVKSTKTEDIKVRVDPLTRHTFEQIAQQEQLDLSDIVRRALREFIQRKNHRLTANG